MVLENARHEHFAHLVAQGENATQAYINAGYSKNGATASAARLLTNANVISRIEQIKANISKLATEKSAISKSWVIDQLVEVVAMGKALEPVIDKDGGITGELKQNLPAANKALELLGKELGMFVDRKEVRTAGILEDMPHDDLTKLQDLLSESIRSNTAASDSGAIRTTH